MQGRALQESGIMAKMWAGRNAGVTDSLADDFNSSIHFDKKMYRQDIQGSMAHTAMLVKQGIIEESISASAQSSASRGSITGSG